MQNGRDFFREPLVCCNASRQLVLVKIIGNGEVRNIGELVTIGQVVNDDDIVGTTVDQGPDQVAANETGTAGDDKHTQSLLSSRWYSAPQ